MRSFVPSIFVAIAVAAAISSPVASARSVVSFPPNCGCYGGLAASAAGGIYLAASGDSPGIVRFDANGTRRGLFASAGGQSFGLETEIAPLGNGDLLASAASGTGTDDSVSEITPEGAFVRRVSGSRAPVSAIAVDPSTGDVFLGLESPNGIGDAGAGIRKISPDGTTSVIAAGVTATNLAFSTQNGHLYALARRAQVITELTTDGEVVRSFATQVAAPYGPQTVQALAIGPDGALYASGSVNQQEIVKLSPDGTMLGAWPTHWGSVATSGGTLVVANSGRVEEVELGQPLAVLKASANNVQTSQTVTLDATGSSEPFGSISRYEWDLDGNGTFETDTGSAPTVSTRFSSGGDRQISVRVSDDLGHTDTASTTVAVSSSHATLAASPALTVTGTPVSFDASGSQLVNSAITDVAFDLDGNGTYEADTGSGLVASRSFSAPGRYTVGVRITRSGGVVDVAGASVEVRLAPSTGPVGLSVNDGALFTNDPHVTLSVNWPALTTTMLVSNDGGFAHALTIPISGRVPWTLNSSGPERLPKTVYLRFDDATQNFQDDIILDQTPPTISTAQTVATAASTRTARAARARSVKVKVRAKDATSGVASVQFAVTKKKPLKPVRYASTITLRGQSARAVWVRAIDRAKNLGRWHKIAQKKRASPSKSRKKKA